MRWNDISEKTETERYVMVFQVYYSALTDLGPEKKKVAKIVSQLSMSYEGGTAPGMDNNNNNNNN